MIEDESPFNRFRANIYSQNGEDGVVRELLRRLNVGSSGWAVEFGAWDGRYLSNTYHLLESRAGFKAVYIEADSEKFAALRILEHRFPNRVVPINARVAPTGRHALDKLLRHKPIPHDFEVLSIDIDGEDYHVWNGLQHYKPQVVIIEINSSLPPDIEQVHSRANPVGSSFRSMLRLGRNKGYTLVCHTGNMIFVRSDLIPLLGIGEGYRRMFAEPEVLFDTSWL
jgi:hypothetical protein